MRVISTYNATSPKTRSETEVKRWCERFERECRSRGIRMTIQRLAVFRAIARDTSHPSAEAVYGGVRRDIPSLSFASVYRILECLAQESFVRRVTARGGVLRYDANLAPHQHMVCRQCTRMIDYVDESLTALPLPRRLPQGFKAEEIETRIVGVCGDCRRNARTEKLARAQGARPESDRTKR